jgi:cystathionine gamma-synthase
MTRWKARTLAAQALGTIDPTTRAVVPPLHMSTTFIRDPDNQYRSGYSYGRPDNATVRQTESLIAALKTPMTRPFSVPAWQPQCRDRAGAAAGRRMLRVADASGRFEAGSPTTQHASGFASLSPDTTDLVAVRNAVGHDTALVYIETPGNPL